LDNQIIFYRIGFNTGDYTSGTAAVVLTYSSGSLAGIVRVTGFVNTKLVAANVLKNLGGTDGTSDWDEGQWSTRRGFPTAVKLNEGRLWWAGRDRIIGSVSDGYESYDDSVIGDAGPINRSIGSGPVDRINWLVDLLRFALGGEMAEHFLFSDALDAPITPTNNNIRSPSNMGSAPVQAVKIETVVVFVDRSGTRLVSASYDNIYQSYPVEDLTIFCPEAGAVGIKRIALQRRPDTRIHCILNDGTAFVLVYDKLEEVKCIIDIDTAGSIEDVIVMPGLVEDVVYYSVARVLNGVTKRSLEKWALASECVGGTLNKQADSFVIFHSDTPTTVITGLDRLNGMQVVVWADGKDFSPLVSKGVPTSYLVSGGQITLPSAVSDAVVGLFYDAEFEGTKLSYGAALGTALNQRKYLNYIGLLLADTHCKGVRAGRSLDDADLYDMPSVEDGAPVDPDTVWDLYDRDGFSVGGDWSTDARLCLYSASPRPANILGVTVSVITNDSA